MELEKVTAEIRPRTQWEAVDLGLSLTREHAGLLFKIWMSSIIPVCLLILAVFWDALFWGCFLIWWLKPIWERVTLFPLSRNLFGETPSLSQGVMVLPRELKKNWLLFIMGIALTLSGAYTHRDPDDSDAAGLIVLYWLVVLGLLFYRSNLYRSLVLPIQYLEGLEKKQFRARSQVLSFRSSGTATALTVLCLMVECVALLGQLYFLYFMNPENGIVGGSVIQFIIDFLEYGFDLFPEWLDPVLALLYVISMTLVTWFYVGGGFGLYVNSRTWTEGWDIELTFKRLGQRVGLLLTFLGLFFVAQPAQSVAEEVTIGSVLESEDFKVQTRENRHRKEGSKDEEKNRDNDRDGSSYSGDGINVFVQGGNLIFWVIVTLAVAGLLWLIITNRQMFKSGASEEFEEKKKEVRTVAGMNVTPESLPKRLVEVARDLWNQGNHKEALGLLYRGAISFLVTRQLVDIDESDTEMDCLERVVSSGESASPQYFRELTGAWMLQAYASQIPDDEMMSRIWNHWPFGEGGKL